VLRTSGFVGYREMRKIEGPEMSEDGRGWARMGEGMFFKAKNANKHTNMSVESERG